jgi:plastocyanin
MSRTCFDRALAGVVGFLITLAGGGAATAQTVGGVVALTSADGTPVKKIDAGGAVVWLEPIGTVAAAPAATQKQATMVQRNKVFLPHVLAVELGTAVDFPNDDPFFHNVFSNYDGQVFDVQAYASKTSRRVVFRRPGIVYVFCNIHESMSAIVAVVPTPYFAVAGADGRYRIQAPPGQYRLHVWHERGDAVALARLERPITVGASGITAADAAVVVSDQPSGPHKNKYGQSYAFAPSGIFYPGARR